MKLVPFLLFLLFASCDNSDDSQEKKVVELSVGINQELRYPLGNRPIEGGYSITKQAKYSEISEISTGVEFGGLNYVYVPKLDFEGQDFVEITLRTSSGNQDFTNSLIVLRITVE